MINLLDADVRRDENFNRAILLLLERIAIALERTASSTEVRVAHLENYGDHSVEHDPDYLAAIAAEVEGRIQGGSTPKVGRDVEVQEIDSESCVSDVITIDLEQQPRGNLAIFLGTNPSDPYILAALEKRDPVYIAAVEIIYSNISCDLWGTDVAGKQIDMLLSMHRGTDGKPYEEKKSE